MNFWNSKIVPGLGFAHVGLLISAVLTPQKAPLRDMSALVELHGVANLLDD